MQFCMSVQGMHAYTQPVTGRCNIWYDLKFYIKKKKKKNVSHIIFLFILKEIFNSVLLSRCYPLCFYNAGEEGG